MNAEDIRKAYIDFFKKRGHQLIPRASLIPNNDPTTLFTGSGMQPLIPYLLGEKHPNFSTLSISRNIIFWISYITTYIDSFWIKFDHIN